MCRWTRCLTKGSRTFCATTSESAYKNFLEIEVTVKQKLLSMPAVAAVAKLATVLLLSLGLVAAAPSYAQKWQDLKPAEQSVLAPLQPDWQSLTDVRKRKWREIAAKYPTMAPDAQKKLQDRMAGWAKLSPDERRKAREQYNELKQLPADKRAAVPQKWDEYRNLPPEKRDELRKKAAEAKPALPTTPAPPAVDTRKP